MLAKHKIAIAAVAVLAVLVTGGVAFAAWLTTGTGGGAASALSLNPPAAANVSASGGVTLATITVSTPPAAPSAAPSGYRVDRVTPNASTGVCYIVGTTGSCSDTGLTAGSYTYNVFSVIGTNLATAATRAVSWTSATSVTTSAVSVTSVSVTHAFTVVPASTTQTAGTAFNVTITAKAAGQTDLTYTGSKTLDWSGGQTIGTFAPAYPTNPVTFTAGVATVSVTLFKASTTAQVLSVADHNDGTYSGATTTGITVNSAGAILSFTTPCPTSSIPSGATWTSSISVGSDAYGNGATFASPGLSFSVTLSGANASHWSLNDVTGSNTSNTTASISASGSPTSSSFTIRHLDSGNSKNATVTISGPSGAGFTSASCTVLS